MSAKTGERVEETLNGFGFEIMREKVRLIEMKDEYMMMLLWLDEDLLQDAMEMLIG